MKIQSLILCAAVAMAPAAWASAPLSHDDFVRAAESTVNGVVAVKSYATPRQIQQPQGGGMFDDPFFEFFFGTPQRQPQRRQAPAGQRQTGLGSGVIISADGLIVTNNHVIDGAERLEVTLNDNRNFAATVVGADPATDLALIRIEAPGDLHVIPMGDSDSLRVGQWVLAVGNPFGFTSTVTGGIVSAKARNISSTTGTPSTGGIEAYIQTDAAVNRGNSGGALVDLDGRLVGINAAIYSQTGTYAGCSFAIPTSIVRKVVGDLSAYGAVQKAFLGISFRELTPELVKELKVEGTARGIYVAEVQDRSAALEGGLREGDIIVAVDGRPVATTADMQEVMARLSPGDTVTVDYIRRGQPARAVVTLRNRNGLTGITRPVTAMGVLGAMLAPAPAEVLERLQVSRGVQVRLSDEPGLFVAAGVPDGFVITSVNNTRVSSPEQVEEIFQAVRSQPQGTDKALFISGLRPDGTPAYFAIALDGV